MGMNQSGQPPIADFLSRVVAWIIDGVILSIAGQIVWAIVFRILPFGVDILVQAIAVAAISAAYFIYMWTTRKQTVGMMLMKLQVQKDGTGAALTQSEAIRRWMYLGLPLALATLISVGGGFSFFAFGGLGALAILFTLASIGALVAIAWEIYLAYATNNDARKQGPHDKAAGS
ncbi:MAG: hypothetical protein QOJ81_2266, partial [Chloroflexota bacterium]|nr:hypothetical protein [Chloroflexota bacterium]